MFVRAARIFGRTSARSLATAAARPAHGRAVATVAIAAGTGAAAYSLTEAKAELSINPLTWFSGSSGTKIDPVWGEVKKEIAAILEDDPTTGPFFIRLAWHCAGSYSAEDGTGGSVGATMRFKPEADHGGNAGLGLARDLLEPVKEKFPELTYADIYTFAGKASVELMDGPEIDWKPGRPDFAEGEGVTPDGRLPDGDKGESHLRAVFNRMGFDDREIVALSGAHALGFCHDDRSGFSGPWTDEPYKLTNKYFLDMLNKKWVMKNWDGPPQFVDAETGSFMMLSTDLALTTDVSFRPHVDRYAADERVFKTEFAAAFAKLLALGTQ